MQMKEFNFLHPSRNMRDADLAFQGIPGSTHPETKCSDYNFIFIQDNWNMAHLFHISGLFKSISEAKRNGWDKPISPGFQDIINKKRMIRITILGEEHE